jgi:hypothetical protein
MTFFALFGHATASSAVNTRLPVAPPGPREAFADNLGRLLGVRVNERVQELIQVRRLDARDHGFLLISFSLCMSIAMLSAAVPVRLPLRHWSM